MRKLLHFVIALIFASPLMAGEVRLLQQEDLQWGDPNTAIASGSVTGHPIDNAYKLSSPYVDVRTYLPSGYVTDGSVDYSTYVQNALDSLTPGGTLFVPIIEIWAQGLVVSNDNVSIVGLGYGSHIHGNDAAIISVQASNFAITGMRLSGTQATGNRSNGLVVEETNGRNYHIIGNYFTNIEATGVVLGATGIESVWIEKNKFLDYYESAVDIVQGNIKRVFILNNYCESSLGNPDLGSIEPLGITAEPQGAGSLEDIHIENNTINLDGLSNAEANNSSGIYLGYHSTPASAMVLKRITIKGNTIRGAGYGMKIDNARYGTDQGVGAAISIAGNTLENCRNHGIWAQGGTDTTHYDSLVIANNIIKGASEVTQNTYDGIHLDNNWQSPVIMGNVIQRRVGETGAANMRYGIYLDNQSITPHVSGNSIGNATSGNILYEGTYGTTDTGKASFGGGTGITKHLSATAALDFTALAGNTCESLSLTVTGAADGDTVYLGVPTALSGIDNTNFTGYVTAADSVAVRRCNTGTEATSNPAAATVRADVWKH